MSKRSLAQAVDWETCPTTVAVGMHRCDWCVLKDRSERPVCITSNTRLGKAHTWMRAGTHIMQGNGHFLDRLAARDLCYQAAKELL